ncbi:SinI family autotransporter-associated protein [Citrobacter sp. Ce006]|uniref:SinI family autotransporter-associated protein n=1 Tax=Citrobacter sp. Ce006 TaxID=2985039 RepID=UPI002578591A|nr:SinI family autotransporter-associated protein [Citrobacter sp. Ce006]MDM3317268.1 SinI family autotransporter-associated protein [Citrobacter sp. Ce006]
MQALLKRRLSKVALALVVAGYCSIPSAIAAKEGKLQGAGSDTWQFSGNTGTIQGTVPWITRSAEKVAEADKNHVTVSIDRGERVVNGEGDKQFHIGDKVTVNWAIGDEQGDLDVSNTATKATVVWIRSKQQDGSEATVISGSAGKDSYTLQESDADYYIGIRITPTTTTGDPNVAELLTLNDLSTGSGGGADDDDIPEGPVVDDSIAVAIYDSENASVNLLKNSSTKLHTGHTYVAQLWKDANKNGTYDTGELVVTNQYDYQWVFTGTSLQLGTAGGDSSVQNGDLLIPETNAEARTSIFPNAGDDGVQGYGLSIKYKNK